MDSKNYANVHLGYSEVKSEVYLRRFLTLYRPNIATDLDYFDLIDFMWFPV